MTRRARQKRVKARTAGQAAVEFMFVAIFLMILTISMIELIMLIYAYSVLADAAKEGVRYAIVHGNTGGMPAWWRTTGASSRRAGRNWRSSLRNAVTIG